MTRAPQRIMVVLPPLEEYSPATGGAVSTVAEALARQWIARGHEVTVLSQSTAAPYETGAVFMLRYRLPETRRLRRAVMGVVRRVRRYDWPLYSWYVWDVRRHVREVRPDWVVLHNDVVLPSLGFGRRQPKVALTLHNSVSSRPLRRAARSVRACALVTAVSGYIADETSERLVLEPGVITVVNNGVQNELYAGVRRELAGDEPLRVAVLGRLLRDKGAHVLLDAVAALRDEGVVMLPTVVGSPDFHRDATDDEDPYVSRIRAAAEALGGEQVPHLGRSAVATLLREHDVVVVPSLFQDPFPLVVFEGMASGCAVIVSDRGGLPEAAGDAGFVVPAGDVPALVGVLRRLHLDRDELRRRQEAGLLRAADNDWSRAGDRWLELMRPVSSG